MAIGNLAWETVQLPLYTIWSSGTRGEILFALFHCTAGDILIAISGLILAVSVARLFGWPQFGARMATLLVLGGIGYTVFSEWLNVEIRRRWAYAPSMPVLPWLGTGLAPLLQWLVVPLAGTEVARRGLRSATPSRDREASR